MPVHQTQTPRPLQLHRYFKFASVLCMVTFGLLPAVNGQKHPQAEHESLTRKGFVVMGHKSRDEGLIEDELHVVHRTKADMPEASATNFFKPDSKDDTIEERLLAKPSATREFEDKEELKNPHPHISIPQLPFCKSTKTTVGSGGPLKSQEGFKKVESVEHEEDDLVGTNDHDDDIEVVASAEHNVDLDRKFLVATLDGKVTLLNKTGHQLWTVKTGPLFSSTISSLQLNENGKWINLIPSLTGGVYKYDGDSLYPMPFNADSLLKKSFKISNDVVITGGKELRTFGIDVKTGNIRYECGISGCIMPGAAEVNSSGKDSSEEPVVLVVKKQLQTVRAIDSSTGAERWNFSVGTHELALAGVTEGCYVPTEKYTNKATDLLKIVIPEGRVFGADRENRVVWDQIFESPISQAWILENGQLISVDPITNTPLTDVPSLYIGIHNQQFYVQESQNTAEKMEKYFELEGLSTNLFKKPVLNIAWKPPAAIGGISGSTALSTIAPTPNWVTFAPTPNFSPIFVYEKDYVGDAILEGPNSTDFEDDDEESDEEDSEEEKPLDFGEGITQVIVMSLWFWWKEVLGISLLTAVLLNLILMKPVMRAVRSQTIREMRGYFNQLWHLWKEEEESRALLSRHSSNLLSLPAPSVEDNDSITMDRRKRSTSCSSTGSLNCSATEERDVYFSSQYLNEFTPIECLGRGGFGVVFEAKKMIDDRTYAVKRITLPDREKARVRVMREVKALAQLDHRNIVRYFNAWIESPPPGWLEKNDPLWAKTLIGSTSPTMDYPSDIFGSSIQNDFSRRRKPDHSKISVPATPSDQPLEDDDSYIIFESSTQKAYSKTSFTVNSTASTYSKLSVVEKEQTSIRIPGSGDASVASSVSSAGGGFFARRPNSLNLHSSISSFHEDEEVDSHQRLISVSHSHQFQATEESDKHVNKDNGEDVETSRGLMYLYIQQELCQKRTLQDWLRAEKNRDLRLVINLFSQIVEAVEYVHSKKLIHRDLKPSNIFLAEVTENGLGILTVKIGDFGLATTAYAELDSEKVSATPLEDRVGSIATTQPIKIHLTGHVGTHLYMSPEQYHRKPYDYKVDIYSLGLIFFELLVPFSTDMERYNTLSGVRKLTFPDEFKKSYSTEYDLIRTMISHNPNERPDATKINAWVRSHNIFNMPLEPDTSGTARGVEHFGERSISSPAEIVVTDEERMTKKKDKHKFYKTQSVM